MTEYILFASYLCAGILTWLVIGLLVWTGRRQMMGLGRPTTSDAIPNTATLPKVTLLIPAKDEAQRITACVRSALDQTYPNFNVIAIDDRSTDDTGKILDDLANEDPRLRILHMHDLPEGWTGKCHALYRAMPHADGDYLLFIDSDVVLAPDALQRCITRAIAHNYDLLSILPRLHCESFWERLLIPLGGAATSLLYTISLTNKDHLRSIAFANGQYLLIRRSAYETLGGHATVREHCSEDLVLARAAKRHGLKVRIFWGTDLAAVRMYRSLAGIFAGWSRNFYSGGLGRPWRILCAIAFILACCFSAYAALAWTAWRATHSPDIAGTLGWLAASLAHLALMTAMLARMYRWSGNRASHALLFPLASAMMLAIFLRALAMFITGTVEWRGTRYPRPSAQSALVEGDEQLVTD